MKESLDSGIEAFQNRRTRVYCEAWSSMPSIQINEIIEEVKPKLKWSVINY